MCRNVPKMREVLVQCAKNGTFGDSAQVQNLSNFVPMHFISIKVVRGNTQMLL